MDYVKPGSFPDRDYLKRRAQKMFEVLIAHHSAEEVFSVLADALLQWQGAYVTDLSHQWILQELRLDDLYLTGMNADLNTIIIDRCERSPKKLRDVLAADAAVRVKLAVIQADAEPIMVRTDWTGKLAVLDGMNRVVAAIRDGRQTIQAFVGRREGSLRLQVAPGIPYSFCRAYRIGAIDDEGLVTVLRIMRSMYVNMDPLLQERFTWEPDLIPLLKRALDQDYRPSLKERFRLWLKRWLR